MPRKYTRRTKEEKSKTSGALNSTRIMLNIKKTPYTLTHTRYTHTYAHTHTDRSKKINPAIRKRKRKNNEDYIIMWKK